MRLGAALPFVGFAGAPIQSDHFARGATLLEGLGFASLWCFDAVGRGFMLPDPLMGLAIAASVTERVELGTAILQLPIRNTAELAHRIFTLNLVASGRLLLGVGPGSTEDDFDAFGADYKGRMTRFAEQFLALRESLATGRCGAADLHPWPAARARPPILVGAWRGAWVERAAAEADGWIASALYNDDATLANAIARYRDGGGTRAVVSSIQVANEIAPTLERLSRFAELGFDDAVVFDMKPSEERFATLLAGFAATHGGTASP